MRTHVFEYLQKILNELPYEDPILDSCCGTETDYYDALFLGKSVRKHDFIEYKQNKIDYICDVCDMAIVPDQHFGLILLLEALEHIEYPRKAVEEITKKLKPGGFLITTVPLGFAIHRHPRDFWRFCPDGFWSLFRKQYNVYDFTIEGHPDFPRGIWATLQKTAAGETLDEENTYKVCHPNIVEVHDEVDTRKRSHRLLKRFAKMFGYELIRTKY